jgi:hypothetical protein
MPKKRTEILPVPAGGAAENVRVVAATEYVLGSCSTPETATRIELVFAGAVDSVNTVPEPLAENWSVTKAAVVGIFPMYDII